MSPSIRKLKAKCLDGRTAEGKEYKRLMTRYGEDFIDYWPDHNYIFAHRLIRKEQAQDRLASKLKELRLAKKGKRYGR